MLLWEAHSIASTLPRLFDGKLPDLNIGTQEGRTVAPSVQAAVEREAAVSPFTSVANGRFKGGFITRSFGRPSHGVHAIQLEMCQSTYMNEVFPFAYDPARASFVQPTVRRMIGAALDALAALPTVAA